MVGAVLVTTIASCGAEPEVVAPRSSALITGTALLIVGNTKLNVGDSAVQKEVQSLGLAVVVKAAAAATTTDATGKQLVLISSTVTSGAVKTKFRSVAIPVIVWEASLLDDMGMVGSANGFGTVPNQRQLSMVTPAADPMAANLSGKPTVTSAASTFTWGKPLPTAVVVAHLASDAQKSAIFRYEKGAQMAGLTAPARRVAFFLEDATASVLTPAGRALGDAAILWATFTTKTNGAVCSAPSEC
ncbi:MAG: hypothetical protein JWM82_1653, partial [Myxococcales bacterium]|nr:hypothetical protein [Myxococcales bacterium]